MATPDEPAEIVDPCFLALTRPPLFLGIPMEAFGLIGIGSMIAVIQHVKYGLIGIALYFVARTLIWEDHNRFSLLAGWVMTRGLQKNRSYWGGSSTSPARLVVRYSREDDTHV